MDSDEAYTPRSGRKKKSTLSKLAARGRRRTEEGEAETSSSFTNGGVPVQHTPKYPIDANVEIRENAEVNEEDSDEGIEVTNDKFSYMQDHRFNNSHGATNDTGQASVDGKTWNDEPNIRDRTDSNHNTSKMDTGFDSYKRQTGGGFSLRNDPLASPSTLPKWLEQQHLAISDPEDLVDHRASHLSDEATGNVLKVREALESESLSYVDVPKSDHKSTKKELKEQVTNSNSSPFRSNLVRGASMSRSDENLTTLYRESLQQKEKEAEHDEQAELADSISALRQGLPKTLLSSMQKSAAAQSLYSSHDRTWGSIGKFGGGFDTMSQRSFQSTSALPLITTKEARNRSFLVGSISGRAALMGVEEMERFFPDHKMRVFSGTWNMYDMKLLPDSLDDWLLPDTSDYIQDMYVIGTQESCPNRREWEIRLQETLGPSHVLFHTAVHGVLYLVVFLRRDLIWFCSVSEEANVQTRLGPSNIATKGAVALCFTFFGTSFLLVNAHLAPHDGKVKERIADYNKIISNLNLPTIVMTNPYSNSQDDATARFDCVFWMGDLNFRLEKERERVDKAMDALSSQEIPSYEDLMRHDELFRVRNEGQAFQDFQEGRIKFKPTYKFDKGTDNYDTSKKLRIPSYTDRILFRSRKKNCISCLFYDSVNSIKDSDHKPVYAMFEVLIRPGKDNIPLSAGQFNREVWLEGNRRRAERLANQKQRSKSSTVCSLQ